VADALSRRYALVSTLNAKLLGFEYVNELYANDDDFASVYGCEEATFGKFYRLNGTCLEGINFVCLRVLCVSCLCMNHMEGV
jgi:hypothetical protein